MIMTSVPYLLRVSNLLLDERGIAFPEKHRDLRRGKMLAMTMVKDRTPCHSLTAQVRSACIGMRLTMTPVSNLLRVCNLLPDERWITFPVRAQGPSAHKTLAL
jgi:hypothetical protein